MSLSKSTRTVHCRSAVMLTPWCLWHLLVCFTCGPVKVPRCMISKWLCPTRKTQSLFESVCYCVRLRIVYWMYHLLLSNVNIVPIHNHDWRWFHYLKLSSIYKSNNYLLYLVQKYKNDNLSNCLYLYHNDNLCRDPRVSYGQNTQDSIII